MLDFNKTDQFGRGTAGERTGYTVLYDLKEESKMLPYSPTENAMWRD